MFSNKFTPEDNILCLHKNAETYTGIEGEDFYGDLCDDCLNALQDKLDFDATNQTISHIAPKAKYHKYTDFMKLVNAIEKPVIDAMMLIDVYLISLDDGCVLIDPKKDTKTREDVGNRNCISDNNRYWSVFVPKRNYKSYMTDALRSFVKLFSGTSFDIDEDRFSFTANINGNVELIQGKIEKLNFEEEK